jgi:hypothetical protein
MNELTSQVDVSIATSSQHGDRDGKSKLYAFFLDFSEQPAKFFGLVRVLTKKSTIMSCEEIRLVVGEVGHFTILLCC